MIPSSRASSREGAPAPAVVGDRDVAGPAAVAQLGVLGPDPGVVEPGGDRVRLEDLALLVGEHRGERAVQDAGARRRRSEAPWRPLSSPSPAASTPISSTSASSTKGVKMPIALEPPPTQAITRVGQRALGGERLLARLVADHPLQVADQRRIGRRADRRADHVVGGRDVGDPVADRGADRLLQRPRAGLDRRHLGAEQPHPLDVGRLAADVLGAHVDDALEAEQGAGGGGRDAVLAGAGLGDDPRLAHPLRQQRLADRVVDLVGAGVGEVLALQIDRAADPLGEPLGEVERRRPADEVAPQLLELAP